MVLEGVYSKPDNAVGKLHVEVKRLPMPLELKSSVHNLRVNLANLIEGGYHICNACTQGQQEDTIARLVNARSPWFLGPKKGSAGAAEDVQGPTDTPPRSDWLPQKYQQCSKSNGYTLHSDADSQGSIKSKSREI